MSAEQLPTPEIEPSLARRPDIERDITTQQHSAPVSGGSVRFDIAYPADSDPYANPLIIQKGGFATRIENYTDLNEALAGLGYTAVNCDALRNLPARRALHRTHLKHPLRRQSQAVWATAKSLKALGFGNSPNLVGHSMGGYEVLDAAAHHPDDFEQVVMLEAAALGHGRLEVCRDLGICVFTDLAADARSAQRSGSTEHHVAVIAKHLGTHLLQIAHEGVEIMSTDARDKVSEFVGSGHTVKFIFGSKDKVIGPKYHAAAASIDPDIVIFDAGHGAPQFQPQKTAEAIHLALSGRAS